MKEQKTVQLQSADLGTLRLRYFYLSCFVYHSK